MLAVGQTLELEIVDLARGGAGVARHAEGSVIFVPHTAPGDRVRVEIVDLEKRFAHAKLLEIVKPSSHRIVPKCAVFGRCGGCQWQHIDYSLQWSTKVSGVRQALKRVGLSESLPPVEQWDLLPARQIWSYRNRIQLRGEAGTLGFHARGSRDLVTIERCEIAEERINESLPAVREEALRLNRPYKVELETMPEGWVRRVWNERHGSAGFRQVHDEQNTVLQHWVSAQIPDRARVWDLFGGQGNLSRGLLPRVQSVDCVDVTAPANPADHTRPGIIHFHRSPVASWVEHQAGRGQGKILKTTPLLVISDPPREGLAVEFNRILPAAERLGVKRWVSIGCDADSWARDLGKMAKRGWKTERIGVLDLFPQTPHVECLAVLSL